MISKMAQDVEEKETLECCPDLICGDNKAFRTMSDNLKVNPYGENSSPALLPSTMESTNSIMTVRTKESGTKSSTPPPIQLQHNDEKNLTEQLTIDTGIAITDKRRINKMDCEHTWKHMNVLAGEAATQRWHWPPYLLVLSVIIMITSHTLHCLVVILEKSLPHVKALQTFLWHMSREYDARDVNRTKKMPTMMLMVAASLAYFAHLTLYCLQLIISWFIEPLWSMDVGKPIQDHKTRSEVTFCASQLGDMSYKYEEI